MHAPNSFAGALGTLAFRNEKQTANAVVLLFAIMCPQKHFTPGRLGVCSNTVFNICHGS